MFIQTETTPNPDALKFIPGEPVVNDKKTTYDFRDAESAAKSPLALRLFRLPGVIGVYLASDFVSVTKKADADWQTLKVHVLGAILDHYLSGFPVVDVAAVPTETAAEDNEVIQQIKQLLDERVRPAVAQDGGDIVFDRFDPETGVVYLFMHGACAGCPSSTATLKMGIENLLKHFVPEVQEVRPAA